MLDAGTYGVSALLLARVRHRPRTAGHARQRFLADLREGLWEVTSRAWVWSIETFRSARWVLKIESHAVGKRPPIRTRNAPSPSRVTSDQASPRRVNAASSLMDERSMLTGEHALGFAKTSPALQDNKVRDKSSA